MKKILLFRHSKSLPTEQGKTDKDRVLARDGIRDAETMGEYFKLNSLIPQHVVCSSAFRAKQTLQVCLEKMSLAVETDFDERIYHDGVDGILDIVRELDNRLHLVMIVGHSPDMESVTEYFFGRAFPFGKFSTSGVALLEFNVDQWKDVRENTGELMLFKTPGMINRKE
ncbi:MAG: histidine phosphatase family protein [Spirochaetes bacterium]|nr:histidine phosphatase family protein [Spirochaetota bacterium]